jgi:hypothetical protein
MFLTVTSGISQSTNVPLSKTAIDSIHSFITATFNKLKLLPKKDTWVSGLHSIGTEGKTIDGKIYSLSIDTTNYKVRNPQLTFYIREDNEKTEYFPMVVVLFSYNRINNVGYLTSYTVGSLNHPNANDDTVYEKDKSKITKLFYDLLKRIDELL